ncbi:MAG TPA: Arc family DNA-binding protein [Planctomycetota bacterium]|nr:Arc family DNA-binding protein [Planctomycetota bacterium]
MDGERKPFLLRLSPRVHDAMRKWAEDEMRSLNGQIEFVLREALRRAGRLKDDRDDARRERNQFRRRCTRNARGRTGKSSRASCAVADPPRCVDNALCDRTRSGSAIPTHAFPAAVRTTNEGLPAAFRAARDRAVATSAS